MPLPFILGGLAVAAGVLGAAGHSVAKEDNERAQRIARDAEELYDNAKESLECAQKKAEASLVTLGESKEEVLKGSIQKFLKVYDRIKNIELKESTGLNELSQFMIDKQGTLQLREISNIYTSSLSSGVAGAVAGSAVALAASGTLPLVTALMSGTGGFLALGEVGLAATSVASGVTFALSSTPLVAIAGPAVFFTALSASMKADENLEKARTMEAEAEAAVEKMKVAETMCAAISDRSRMFNELLTELDELFSECIDQLGGIVDKKAVGEGGSQVDARSFTQDEVKLVAVTRSLAGAVKAVVDTPILNKEGSVSSESQDTYDNIAGKLPMFSQSVNETGLV